ncbi:MAG: hypothetical protein ACM3KT_03385, partial [Deltaproteobacteria bacterium]
MPVIVTVAGPAMAVLAALKVSVVDAVELAGLNDAVTPLGRPEALNDTALENPLDEVTAIVVPAFAPWFTLTLCGEADRAKSAVP